MEPSASAGALCDAGAPQDEVSLASREPSGELLIDAPSQDLPNSESSSQQQQQGGDGKQGPTREARLARMVEQLKRKADRLAQENAQLEELLGQADAKAQGKRLSFFLSLLFGSMKLSAFSISAVASPDAITC
jgi:hypothetical protein